MVAIITENIDRPNAVGDEAVTIHGLCHRYGTRVALGPLDLTVHSGELFVFVGPNGGGKTTLFRLLSTLMPIDQGSVSIFASDLRTQATRIRRRLGVVFQAPSLDKKLTVDENLAQQGALYGIVGRQLRERREEVLQQLGVMDRRHDRVETLSGGLKRRVDLAKSLLHEPEILLLDEPTTGLDPGARSDLWRYLRQLQESRSMTLIVTSHLLEEADRADRVAILHQGQLVALGTPSALRAESGQRTLQLESETPDDLARQLNAVYECKATVIDQSVRVPDWPAAQSLDELFQRFASTIKSIQCGQSTLEDVFIRKTGHRFWIERSLEVASLPKSRRRA